MDKTSLTIEVDATLRDWLDELAQASATTPAAVAVKLLREEQARRAMEAVAAWARDEEGAPSIEEIDAARARMLGDEGDGS